jgi:hypothetical protein
VAEGELGLGPFVVGELSHVEDGRERGLGEVVVLLGRIRRQLRRARPHDERRARGVAQAEEELRDLLVLHGGDAVEPRLPLVDQVGAELFGESVRVYNLT